METYLEQQSEFSTQYPMEVEIKQEVNSQVSVKPESSISQQEPQEFFDEQGCLEVIRIEKQIERSEKKRKPKVKKRKREREIPQLKTFKVTANRVTLKKGVFQRGKSSLQRALGFNEQSFLKPEDIILPLKDEPIEPIYVEPSVVYEPAVAIAPPRILSIDELLARNYDPIINELDALIPELFDFE